MNRIYKKNPPSLQTYNRYYFQEHSKDFIDLIMH